MHTWKLTDCRTDLAIIYNTTKSSKEKQNYICCYLVFVLRKSLCSLLEWSQDINIKSKIFRIKTQHDKIISDVYATPFTCKIKKKKKKDERMSSPRSLEKNSHFLKPIAICELYLHHVF